MKKIIFALVAAAIMLCSCKKDNESTIVGKWNAESYSSFGYKSGKLQYSETEYYDAISEQLFFVFNSDGTFSQVHVDEGRSQTITGTYLVIGSKLTLSPKLTNSSDTISSGLVYSIKTLNNNSLVLRFEEEDGDYLEVEEITFKRTK